ncbi:MAG: WecB/TagA/CpsF family glycosyl transferase, N-acetylglucosaminyldiphosphoundecaprenol [Candidatus Doudnabacteria bacterium]|nr:WecB/TagA/CpsF family glycosyl transferase, N-acetylglucosaminyldiphosphoundecaprenol [Candidatus Doudnabacteria bacterium]
MNIELLGIKVNTEPKKQIIEQLQARIRSGQKSFIVTPYSEFFYRGFFDFDFKKILNKADFSLPDGIAVQWIAYYLSIPLKAKSFYGKVFEAIWQAKYSLAQILFEPAKLRMIIKEKISGADFFWDLCRIADQDQLSVFLLGGFGDTSNMVAKEIKKAYPNIKIAGISNSDPNDKSLVEKINNADADILMVAFGPQKQERWIIENLERLNVKIVIGLGGTFDYIAGRKIQPPKWIRAIGLEWLFRLITQPSRFKRIWQATFGLIRGTVRFKVYSSMPFRPNVVGVIINQQKQVFVAKRLSWEDAGKSLREDHWQFPQGGIDLHEDPDKTIIREIGEEIHTKQVEILGRSEKTNTYFWNHTLRPLFFNRLKFKGQEQIIYYLKYTGADDDIILDQQEFCDYKWVAVADLPKIVHRYREGLIKIVMAEIGRYIK